MIPPTINVASSLETKCSHYLFIDLHVMQTFPEPPTLQDTEIYCTNAVKHMSHVCLSSLLLCSTVAPRSTPSHPCQRIFLLGRPVPIRQGARPFKTPREHETEPGRDVSWLSHLPVSGMVKLLSWGVTLGVLCVLLKRVCVCTHVRVALGQESLYRSSEESSPQTTCWYRPLSVTRAHVEDFDQNLNVVPLFLRSGQISCCVCRNIFEWQAFQGNEMCRFQRIVLNWIEVDWSYFTSAHFLWKKKTIGGILVRILNCLRLVPFPGFSFK